MNELNQYAPGDLATRPPDEFHAIPGAEKYGWTGQDIWYSVAGDPNSPKTLSPHITDIELYRKSQMMVNVPSTAVTNPFSAGTTASPAPITPTPPIATPFGLIGGNGPTTAPNPPQTNAAPLLINGTHIDVNALLQLAQVVASIFQAFRK